MSLAIFLRRGSIRVPRFLSWPAQRLCLVATLSAGALAHLDAQSYTFTTIAGQAQTAGTADGSGADARFRYPNGVAVDADGNVFVADTSNHTIRRISASGDVSTYAGKAGTRGVVDGPAGTARFNEPVAIAVDRQANVFVIERGGTTVRKITPAGDVSTFAGLTGTKGSADGKGGNARFNGAQGIATDKGGYVFVADTFNYTIRKIAPDGMVTTFAGLPGSTGSTDGVATSARFVMPVGITVDPNNDLYVTDSVQSRIRKVTAGSVVTTFPAVPLGLANTPGIAVDPTGNLYVVYTNGYCIRKYAPNGTMTILAGTATSGAADGAGSLAQFNFPIGIAIDGNNNLYVADSSNHAIRKIVGNVVSTLAGPSNSTGSIDGPGRIARFNYPRGITGDSKGNVYVCDLSNHAIRRISPSGDVTTVAGQPGAPGGVADGVGANARFEQPAAICADANDNLYVADNLAATIRKIGPGGVVTTIAGSGYSGKADGIGTAASFLSPNGIACDARGTIYVSETTNQLIRSITSGNVVTTIAGTATKSGADDGAGLTATFNYPWGIATGPAGEIYVADYFNNVLRRISPSYVVSTIVRNVLYHPSGVTVDKQGNLFVADTGNRMIQKVSPDGNVTAIGGSLGDYVAADGTGKAASFLTPSDIWVNPQGVLYIADARANTISIGVLDSVPVVTAPPQPTTALTGTSFSLSVTATGGGLSYQWRFNGTAIPGATRQTLTIAAAAAKDAGDYSVDLVNSAGSTSSSAATVAVVIPTLPAISTPPRSITAVLGAPATFSIAASGGGLTYQWKLNGSAISGATNPTLTIPAVSRSDAGSYTVQIANPLGTIVSSGANLEVTLPGRLVNLSIMASLASANDQLAVGMSVGGAGTKGAKPLLIRAVGPSLASFGVTNPVEAPTLRLYVDSTKAAENSGWGGNPVISALSAQVGAFAFGSNTSKDAALYVADASGGGRSAAISGTGAGLVLVEVYDASANDSLAASTPRLTNVSVLKSVGDGMTAGFVVGGVTPVRVLVRAVGPSLRPFGVIHPAADPRLDILDAQGNRVGFNAGWGDDRAIAQASNAVGAFPYAAGSADAAVLQTVQPGGYTARVSAADSTGTVLIEIYEVP